MTTVITVLARIIRCTASRLVHRLIRKANIELGRAVGLPPFIRFVLNYKADIGELTNDYRPPRRCRIA